MRLALNAEINSRIKNKTHKVFALRVLFLLSTKGPCTLIGRVSYYLYWAMLIRECAVAQLPP